MKILLVRRIIFAGSFLLQLGALCFQSRGAAGDVDLSFDPGSGVNGQVTALALQPDGKVIIGGWFTAVKGLPGFNIARLNEDGSGDGTFNSTELPGGVICLSLQPDGKVLVGNFSGVFRLNADGSLDPTFSATMGVFDGYEGVYSIAVQADGKVLIGGVFAIINGTSRGGIARLNANGSLDSSFNPGPGTVSVYGLAVQPDGRVLIGGYLYVNGTNRNDIARLNVDGSWDSGFNPGTGPNSWIASLALQPDGKVVIGGGFTAVNGTNCSGVARLNANGSLDGSFKPGTVLTADNLTYNVMIDSLAVQADGKVVVGGIFALDVTNSINVARLNADGTLDNGFNQGPGANSDVFAVAVQSDGRILLGGAFTVVRGTPCSHMARLNAGGDRDASFNAGQEISGQVSSTLVQPDGKVLIGGWFDTVQGTNRNRIARLNANGSLDNTFDPGTGANSNVKVVALQPDGKVLIGGSFNSVNGTNCDSVARLNANGSLDASFQPDLASLNPGNDCPFGYWCTTYSETTAILAQPDGKVLIGGSLITYAAGFDEAQYIYRQFCGRFNADGSLDNSFIPGTNISVSAFARQPDGKVLIGGSLIMNGTNYSVARLNAEGSLDSSFHLVSANGVSCFALQPDGKVIIGGEFSMVDGAIRPLVARLHADGNPDSSFDPGTGLKGVVYSVASQPDGKVLIGGSFEYFIGTNYNYGIARSNADGSPDASFNRGTGAGGAVFAVALQSDGNVLVGGSFTTIDGVARPKVARLYGDTVAPSLKIARSSASVIVSWPVTGLNLQLQETTNLSLPTSWLPVALPTVTNGSQISVTVPTSIGSKLFRLKSP